MKSCLKIIIIFLLLLFGNFESFSQGQDKTVFFTARVVSSRNLEYLPLAYLYNPVAGRGALSDNLGIVEMQVFPGDSLIFSYVGFKKKLYIVPKDNEQIHQTVIKMEEESTMLAEVKVYRHADESEFKQAFLDMKLPDEKLRDNARNNLDKSDLKIFAMQAGMGAASNFRNFSDQMTFAQANKAFYNSPMLTLTNPFAWMNFLKSIKNGDLKRKDYQKAYEIPPKENLSNKDYLRNIK
ncbi:MAG: hypothetical protein RJA76_107 [Bacteroidota bacterium]|jgi:hypothetical protein